MIDEAIASSIKVKEALRGSAFVEKIRLISDAVSECITHGGKVLIFGNGGSAADAEHMAAELVGRFKKERRALPAISLTANTSSMTAIANDYTYDATFKRQMEALAGPGDIAIGLSTSGNSPNVLEAVNFGRKKNIKTVLLLGKDGGKMAGLADLTIIVPSHDTPRIQEAHILIIHIICALVEERVT